MKVLLISLDNIGDVVFTSLLSKEIKEKHPNSKVDFLCKSYTETVVTMIPSIDSIYKVKPYWARNKNDKGSFIDFVKMFMALRKNDYDVVINTSKSWRPSFFSRLIGINKTIGLKAKKNNWFLTDVVENYSSDVPVMTSIANFLTPLSIDVMSPRYQLVCNNSYTFNGKYIILHPFAGAVERCAKMDVWLSVADELRHKFKVIWFGSSRELNTLRLEYADRLESDEFSDVLSNNDFQSAIELLPNASLFIGHDSGPLHLASSFNTPVLGLFLPGEPHRTFPQGGKVWDIIHHDTPSELKVTEVLRGAGKLLK
ncbi:glycosyltransferase family 9 protein [Vibrio ezurae]|uniref:Putative glycosyltransferase n=1 Tax=Vibrio ezurae NBRC 102218 TaxID=1219080 RepID=U3B3N6_9VIBR|nr:glycosyltransferase family 9 protein [Vibrio ezurae]GAD80545.1 putative glycosyltransferase [Vibrio ezurae NBRC 102218]